jgi:hypothetical protein
MVNERTYNHLFKFTIDMDTGETTLINGIDNETIEYDGTDFDSIYEEIKKLAAAGLLPADLPEKFAARYRQN